MGWAAQASHTQRHQNFPPADQSGARVDGLRVSMGRKVVMVAVEAPVGKGQPSGEIVQLGKGHVADQMRPQPVPVRPYRRVDEDGHGVQRKTLPQ